MKIQKIIEKVLSEGDENPLDVWVKTTVKKEIPGIEVDNYGDMYLKGAKDPVSGKPVKIAYVSTIGFPQLVLKVPNLNIGTTRGQSEDVYVSIKSAKDATDDKFMKDLEQKLKIHFVKWSKFFTKYEALYKEREGFKH